MAISEADVVVGESYRSVELVAHSNRLLKSIVVLVPGIERTDSPPNRRGETAGLVWPVVEEILRLLIDSGGNHVFSIVERE